jgi:hypothetical protein
VNQAVGGTVAYDTAGRLYTAFLPDAGNFWVGHKTDSGWTAGLAVSLFVYGWFWVDVGCLTVANDGSPWYFAYVSWMESQYVWGQENALIHYTGDTWVEVSSGSAVPLALVPHGDSVGWVTSDLPGSGFMLCDGDTVGPVNDNLVAGLAYTAEDIPLVAWVPRYSSAAPVFAFRTDRWRTENIPGPAGVNGIDIEVDTAGQVVIVYSTQDSGLWCARGTDVVGFRQVSEQPPARQALLPTVMRGVLNLEVGSRQNTGSRGELLDAAGRRVAELRAGANDVSRLAPGVYFVRQGPSAAVHRVVFVR